MASIKIRNIDKFVRGLKPVTSTEITTKTGEFNEEGLFSEKIFGVEGSLDRQKTFSYVSLNAKIIHPAAYKILIRLDRKLEKMFSTEQSYSLDGQGNVILDDGGVTGIGAFIDLFPKINFRGDTDTRVKLIKLMQDTYKDGALFIDKLPIIPPDFRPAFKDEKGNWTVDELNNIYIGVMRKAYQMKGAGGGGALYDLLNFGLQKAVNDHDKFIRTKMSKKSGLIRSNMLGKRIDYSGRAVITPGPQLDISHVGVPLRMAVSIFEPFLKHYLLFSKKFPHTEQLASEIKAYTGMDLSADSVGRILKGIRTGDKIPQQLRKLIFDATEIVMKGRVVLLKRDPALHDGSYRSFYPVLVEGNTIQLSTTEVGSFNADFDGDAMAIYHPLSREAQTEARERMMRPEGSKNSSEVVFELGKEMCAGLYVMSKNVPLKKSPIAVTSDDLEKATDPYIPVRFRGRTTTMGQAIINNVFPSDFQWIPGPVTKKIMNGLANVVVEKYGDDVAKKIYSKLAKIGFKFATIIAPTITLDMLEIPNNIKRLKEKLKTATPVEGTKIMSEIVEELKKHLKGTGMYDLIESGAGKGWDQPKQILGAKGVFSDPKGNPLNPVASSFSDGLKTTEFFNAASGARKGMADRALNTADTGYFTRQLVYFLSPVEVDPYKRDCGTNRAISLRLTDDIIKRLTGRNILTPTGKLKEFKKSEYKVGQTINLRSPILCETPKVCVTCYGRLVQRHRTPYVGVLAGAAIGERGTQLIMRTFHTGGAANAVTRDVLDDLIQNDPLVDIDKKRLENFLEQADDKVFANRPCKLTIDMSNYINKDTIQIEDKKIWVKSLLCNAEFENLFMTFALDYSVEVGRPANSTVTKDSIVLNYSKGDLVIQVPFTVENIKDSVNYVKRLVGGKEIYKGPGHLLQKVYKVYKAHSNMDLVHLEVLVSQCFRDRKAPEIPARLGKKWDPIMANIKNNVFSSGFIQGLAFENVNKAVETGLISDQILDRSIMERIVTGELVQK